MTKLRSLLWALLLCPFTALAQTANLGDFNIWDTVYVPLSTYSSVGASITITGLAVTDIEVYKDGSVTQRASDSGYTLLDTDGIDIDTTTGLHGFSIDLKDNTTAGFWAAGSQYFIVVNAITVDTQTVVLNYNFTIGRQALATGVLQTTIATLASQTSFTIREGSADDNAYNGWAAYVRDVTTATQVALGIVSDYTGVSKTVTLSADPAVFTMAATDLIVLQPAFLTNSVTTTAASNTAIATELLDRDMTAHQTQGTLGQAIGDPGADANTIFKAVVTDATGATVGVDAAAILADTGTDGVQIPAGEIDAAAIANGAIDAATFAADVDAEILSYIVDDATLIDASELNADIDSLVFTKASELDVNVQSTNGVTITGDGSVTPFGVAFWREQENLLSECMQDLSKREVRRAIKAAKRYGFHFEQCNDIRMIQAGGFR